MSLSRVKTLRIPRKPCTKPFDATEIGSSSITVKLAFNFWIENAQIRDDEISQTIMNMYFAPFSSKFFTIPPGSVEKIDHLIVVAAHGISHVDLNEHIQNLRFLPLCSSVPVNHSPQSVGGDQVAWSEIISMNSAVLWPERTSIDPQVAWKLDYTVLFTDYCVLYQATTSQWEDELCFIMDVSIVEKMEDLLQKCDASMAAVAEATTEATRKNMTVNELADDYSKSKTSVVFESSASVMLNKVRTRSMGHVIGKVRRLSAYDNGFFLYCKNDDGPASLHIVWNRMEIDSLDAVPHHNGDEVAEKLPSTGVEVSFAKNLSMEAAPNTDLYLNISRAIRLNKHNHLDDIADSKKMEDDVQDVLDSKAKKLFEEFSENDFNNLLFRRLQDFVLSEDMLSVMGFTVTQSHNASVVFMDTLDSHWSDGLPSFKPSVTAISDARVLRGNRFAELEEGEEIEAEEEKDEDGVSDQVVMMAAEVNEITIPSIQTGSAESLYQEMSEKIAHMSLPLKICSLDCEMCSTDEGLELTRISLFCPKYGLVLDTLVQPSRQIDNYFTEFSGITKEMLEHVTVRKVDVQNILRRLIDSSTILVGHSLDSDLKVLHINHRRNIDTAALYPHYKGLPFKQSLKKLVGDFAGRVIQQSADGHDSIQDAVCSLELAFLKVKKAVLEEEKGIRIASKSCEDEPPWMESVLPKQSLFEKIIERLAAAEESKRNEDSLSNGKEADSFTPNNKKRKMEAIDNNIAKKERSETAENPPSPSNFKVFVRSRQLDVAAQHRWDNYSFGFRPCSDPLLALPCIKEGVTDGRGPSSKDIHGSKHSNNDEVLDAVIGDLGTISSSSSESRSLHWVDFSFGENFDYPDENADGGSFKDNSSSVAQLDEAVLEIYNAAPINSCVMVITQGSMRPLKIVNSQKLRNRWEAASAKKKSALANCGRTQWDVQVDEARFRSAAALAKDGAAFIALKGRGC